MNTPQNRSTFTVADVPGFKQKMLNWVKPFGIFCFLDNQQYELPSQQTECLLAAGVADFVSGTDLKAVDRFLEKKQWAFGHLSYELKGLLYHLPSTKEDRVGFPLFYFFSPKILLEIRGNVLTIHADEPEKIFAEINAIATDKTIVQPPLAALPQPVLQRHEYLEKIKALQAHIHRGDCYEINFCQAFFADDVAFNPFAAFDKLMQVSPAPFSAFYRLNAAWLLCASPERFLLKKGNRLLSQPMKGTVRRAVAATEDATLKEGLRWSAKEQSENVMIVDLVRNDLTRICKEASVKVDELFGIYSFPQVHQMVSTVSGELKEGVPFSQIIEAAFPMGSMTGAPKHRVLQLIDEYEPSARGIFSGAVGYINPEGDFDFNVVIRSLLYNQTRRHLSYQVGSGITFYSSPEKEWEECMLKAAALRKTLA